LLIAFRIKELTIMARGSKEKYTSKQKRQAEHIAEGIKKRGGSTQRAKRIAWATVNKETGGGKKAGSGRGKKVNRVSSRIGGQKGGKIGGKIGGQRRAKLAFSRRARKPARAKKAA
jgi:hypothetical protein